MSPPGPEPVNFTEHVETPAVVPADRLQVLESNVPEPGEEFRVKVTRPNGLVGPVALVSITVAVHREGWFTTTVVSQLTLVEVGALTEGVTDISKNREVGKKTVPPEKLAVIL